MPQRYRVGFRVDADNGEWLDLFSNLSFGSPPRTGIDIPITVDEEIDIDAMTKALMQMERSLGKTSEALAEMGASAEKAIGGSLVQEEEPLPLREVIFIIDCTVASPKRYSFETRLFPDEYAGQFALLHSDGFVKSDGILTETNLEFWAVHKDKDVIDALVDSLTSAHQEFVETYKDDAQSSRFYTAGILDVRPVKKKWIASDEGYGCSISFVIMDNSCQNE